MRLTLGAIMTAHGYHKVFGGLHGFTHAVGSMGLPSWLGYVSAFTELLGGLLLIIGFFTRPAALAISINLSVAIWKVHLHNGLLGSPDHPGYEYEECHPERSRSAAKTELQRSGTISTPFTRCEPSVPSHRADRSYRKHRNFPQVKGFKAFNVQSPA